MGDRTLLIFLHGSGGDGIELRSFLQVFRLPSYNMQTFRQVLDSMGGDLLCPSAPSRPYSPAGGERLHVWFDRSPSFVREGMSSDEDTSGMDESFEQIKRVIAQQESSYDHIILGGFSMGGGLALCAFRKELSPKLRAVFTIGSFLVNKSAVLQGDGIAAHAQIPLLMMHGSSDSLISPAWGKQTATNLYMKGIDVEYRSYLRVDHELAEEQLVDALTWVEGILRRHRSADCKGVTGESRSTSAKATAGSSHKDVDMDDDSGDERDGLEGLARAVDKAALEDSKSARQEADSKSFPYHIEYDSRSASASRPSPRVVIHYQVPEECVEMLTLRPVMACGSAFEVTADPLNKAGVQVVAMTYDPEKTAQEIGQRLMLRYPRSLNNKTSIPLLPVWAS